MSAKKLSNEELGSVSGGQLMVDDVMGVKGLCMCTGAPNEKNSEGVYWYFHGIALTKEEAIKKLKRKATRGLDEDDEGEAFLSQYIYDYNRNVNGDL